MLPIPESWGPKPMLHVACVREGENVAHLAEQPAVLAHACALTGGTFAPLTTKLSLRPSSQPSLRWSGGPDTAGVTCTEPSHLSEAAVLHFDLGRVSEISSVE